MNKIGYWSILSEVAMQFDSTVYDKGIGQGHPYFLNVRDIEYRRAYGSISFYLSRMWA